MQTYFDVIQNASFREFVAKRLLINGKYYKKGVPINFPKLYQYRSLSEYAVNDIIEQKVTTTSIGHFNDLFDGAIHRYWTKRAADKSVKRKLDEIRQYKCFENFSSGNSLYDSFKFSFESECDLENRLKFRLLESVGTYVSCFSTEVDSVLMWAHYAASSTGICTEYDFNLWGKTDKRRYFLFPVKYSKRPISLSDLLSDETRSVCEYPLDAAALCATLNKSKIWRYENEWRIAVMNLREKSPFVPMTISLDPAGIYLGYHFLKPFFYYDASDGQKKAKEKEHCVNLLNELNKLLSYVEIKEIPLFFMIPLIGKYSLKACALDVKRVKAFIIKHFTDHKGLKAENIRFYWTVHDDFSDNVAKSFIRMYSQKSHEEKYL